MKSALTHQITKALPKARLQILRIPHIEYPTKPITYGEFFSKNNLYQSRYINHTFIITGKDGNKAKLYTNGKGIYECDKKLRNLKHYIITTRNRLADTIAGVVIKNARCVAASSSVASPVYKVSSKKVILGKLKCIYKIPSSRKEYVKYKGRFITVADYKKQVA
jgi:hypothetical protein